MVNLHVGVCSNCRWKTTNGIARYSWLAYFIGLAFPLLQQKPLRAHVSLNKVAYTLKPLPSVADRFWGIAPYIRGFDILSLAAETQQGELPIFQTWGYKVI